LKTNVFTACAVFAVSLKVALTCAIGVAAGIEPEVMLNRQWAQHAFSKELAEAKPSESQGEAAEETQQHAEV